MQIILNHKKVYITQTIVQVFFQNEKFNIIEAEQECDLKENDYTICHFVGDTTTVKIYYNGKLEYEKQNNDLKPYEVLYYALCEYTKKTPPWGYYTGVRPTKIISDSDIEDLQDAIKKCDDEFKISPQKAKLAYDVAMNSKNIKNSGKNALYISIPYCATRCTYCSFISNQGKEEQINEYLKVLDKELDIIKQYDFDMIYIGGGTPSILTNKQTEFLMNSLHTKIDLSKIVEFTCECGRADTISYEKLAILKDFGVNRIAINPQTLNNETLSRINRKATVEQFDNAFEMARKLDFDIINCDIIVGLENEKEEDVLNTVNGLIELSPENITVHTLSIKRSASLSHFSNQSNIVNNALNQSYEQLYKKYIPYYLYKQKNTLGNFENIGFAKSKEHICHYNIHTIEESKTIVAVGANATTKIVDEKAEPKIYRQHNAKDAHDYIKWIDEIIKSKKEIENRLK